MVAVTFYERKKLIKRIMNQAREGLNNIPTNTPI
jgi:hypothetical protein